MLSLEKERGWLQNTRLGFCAQLLATARLVNDNPQNSPFHFSMERTNLWNWLSEVQSFASRIMIADLARARVQLVGRSWWSMVRFAVPTPHLLPAERSASAQTRSCWERFWYNDKDGGTFQMSLHFFLIVYLLLFL
jgi:hypothetical protein